MCVCVHVCVPSCRSDLRGRPGISSRDLAPALCRRAAAAAAVCRGDGARGAIRIIIKAAARVVWARAGSFEIDAFLLSLVEG